MEIVYQTSFFLLVSSVAISFIRLWKGPHAVDRVLCLDLLALVTAGLICVHSIHYNQAVFLDAILVLAIISFLGTVVLARLIEKGREGQP